MEAEHDKYIFSLIGYKTFEHMEKIILLVLFSQFPDMASTTENILLTADTFTANYNKCETTEC